jgi:hypothetical protein
MGLPVLASDVPGIREIEGEGMTLLDPHDPGAWAYEMGERISAGPGRLPAGQDLPVTLGEHLGQLEAWYDDLLDERRLRLVGGA